MVDWLIMLDLVLLSAYFVNFNQLNHNVEKSAAIVLLILPFAYFGLYLIAKIVQILWLVHVCTATVIYHYAHAHVLQEEMAYYRK